ncbi:MAG: 30S ribosomal protein S1 [Bdellovibrionales bacterium]
MLDTEEKKKNKKLEVLAALDAGDKDIPANPGQLEEASKGTTEFDQLFNSTIVNKEFKVGDIVKGKITEIRNDCVIVDIDYKSESIIPKSEFRALEGQEKIEVGQEIEVCIDQLENENGIIVLSKDKADIKKAWQDIIKATENNETVKGLVIAQVKGGLSVDIGVRAFLPGSQLNVRPVRNMKSYIGQTLDFKVIKVNQKRGNIVLSRKVILEKERANLPESAELKEGSIVKGIVKNITNYGAFVDLGEIDGLLHITDMSWSRIEHPSDVLKNGQEVDLKILKIDSEKNRISLGLKQLNESQWEDAISKYEVGTVLKGKISNIVDYGAFVTLEDGLEGLVHINEISWTKKIKNASQALKPGEEIQVKIIDIQKDSHKLSLSIKQTMENPWHKISEKYSANQEMEVPIVSISVFGLFVKVDEDIDGLVHVSDLSWTEIVDPFQKYKVGDKVKVKILDINPAEEKFSLGIKQLQDNPWSVVEEKYPVGSRHLVEVTRVVEFGVFVKLQKDIEGLIHISELSKKRIDKPQDVVSVGDEVTAEILNIDQDSKKIGLSIRIVESEGDSKEAVKRTTHKKQNTNNKNNSGFMGNMFAKALKKSMDPNEESSKEQKD